jgi:hypothetical protein
MAAIEKEVDISAYQGINLNKRQDYLNTLKKDLHYHQDK